MSMAFTVMDCEVLEVSPSALEARFPQYTCGFHFMNKPPSSADFEKFSRSSTNRLIIIRCCARLGMEWQPLDNTPLIALYGDDGHGTYIPDENPLVGSTWQWKESHSKLKDMEVFLITLRN